MSNERARTPRQPTLGTDSLTPRKSRCLAAVFPLLVQTIVDTSSPTQNDINFGPLSLESGEMTRGNLSATSLSTKLFAGKHLDDTTPGDDILGCATSAYLGRYLQNSVTF